jgi:adenylosuccinate synthase
MAHRLAVILLSGPIGSGKSLLSKELARRYDAGCVGTSELIAAASGRQLSRADLQRVGHDVSFQGGAWIAGALDEIVRTSGRELVVVDCVRTLEQVQLLRSTASGRRRIVHVHLTAQEDELAERYRLRARTEDANLTWRQAMQATSEAMTKALEAIADVVIDTTRLMPEDVAVRTVARIYHSRPPGLPNVDVIVGGQWGSEGKGNLAFTLAPEYDLLVRVGAPNVSACYIARHHSGYAPS